MPKDDVEIILVEDNEDDATLTKRAFRSHNLHHTLVHLKNGQEAINFIFHEKEFEGRKFSQAPKVILLDLNMPKIGGIEVLKRIKTDTKTRCIPVVILTSSAEDPDIVSCYENGANSYIVKPVEFDNFIKTVMGLGIYWSVLNKTC